MTQQVGTFIRTQRQKLNLTQWHLAKALGWKSAQFISNIERNEALLPADKVQKLSALIKVKPEALAQMHLQAYSAEYMKRVNGRKKARARKSLSRDAQFTLAEKLKKKRK